MFFAKGDNNLADDTELYARGQDHLSRKEDIVGSVRGYIPVSLNRLVPSSRNRLTL